MAAAGGRRQRWRREQRWDWLVLLLLLLADRQRGTEASGGLLEQEADTEREAWTE